MGSIPAPATPAAVTQLWAQRATSVLGGAAASVTFSGLSDSAYRFTINAAITAGTVDVRTTFNGDTGANYDWQNANASGGANASNRATGQANIRISAAGAVADLAFGVQGVIQKPLAGSHAHVVSYGAYHRGVNAEEAVVTTARWTNTGSKITQIVFSPSASTFKSDGVFTIEGIV